MITYDFIYMIPNSYFPLHQVVKQFGCHVSYRANNYGEISLTVVGFNPYMPMLNTVLYCRLIAEIEGAAKEHYNDIEVEKYIQ